MLYGDNEYGSLPYADVSTILAIIRALTGIVAIYFATDKFAVFISPAEDDAFLAAKKDIN